MRNFRRAGVAFAVLALVPAAACSEGSDDFSAEAATTSSRPEPTTTTRATAPPTTVPPTTVPPTTAPPPPTTLATLPPTTAAPAPSCHPSYEGACVPFASDVDCAGGSGDGPEYTGYVQVVGPDEYDLDADGDGYGCE